MPEGDGDLLPLRMFTPRWQEQVAAGEGAPATVRTKGSVVATHGNVFVYSKRHERDVVRMTGKIARRRALNYCPEGKERRG